LKIQIDSIEIEMTRSEYVDIISVPELYYFLYFQSFILEMN
jgi:hypothetical protein